MSLLRLKTDDLPADIYAEKLIPSIATHLTSNNAGEGAGTFLFGKMLAACLFKHNMHAFSAAGSRKSHHWMHKPL